MFYRKISRIYCSLYFCASDYIFRLFCDHLQNYNILGTKYNLILLKKLEKLNQRRIDIVNKISEIKPINNVCISCNGLCCRGNFSRFYAIDYIIRLGGKNPINDFNMIKKQLPPIHWVIHNLKKLISEEDEQVILRQEKAIFGIQCPNWIEHIGCSLPLDQKPMVCWIWNCGDYRNSFSDENINSLRILIVQLLCVSYKTYNLYRQTTKEVFGRNEQ